MFQPSIKALYKTDYYWKCEVLYLVQYLVRYHTCTLPSNS